MRLGKQFCKLDILCPVILNHRKLAEWSEHEHVPKIHELWYKNTIKQNDDCIPPRAATMPTGHGIQHVPSPNIRK